ncbi:MAG: adenylyltransferase/cytidyltransferase family protein [Patescibacteria group bacterium]
MRKSKKTRQKSGKKVFVSGCYDILHAGHVQFFEDAKALGDHLTVCFASDEVLLLAKKRPPSIPQDNKQIILSSIRCIDRVVTSSDLHPVFDFEGHIKELHPDILAVTDDDKNVKLKKEFCDRYGMTLVVLPKRNIVKRVSTTSVLASIKDAQKVPLRVDFGGGWLDVPSLARPGAYIVNCAISPLVSLGEWPYEKGAGLGGSAAYALLQIKSGVKSELDMGVGWQDPAIMFHTGFCVWKSGSRPILDAHFNSDWLLGKMLIYWTGKRHLSTDHLDNKRDYNLIEKAGKIARDAAYKKNILKLAQAVNLSYKAQIKEGMEKLPTINKSIGKKYVGAGFGGYGLYIFKTQKDRDNAFKNVKGTVKIEPYMREVL